MFQHMSFNNMGQDFFILLRQQQQWLQAVNYPSHELKILGTTTGRMEFFFSFGEGPKVEVTVTS